MPDAPQLQGKREPELELLFCTARVRMSSEIAQRIRIALQDEVNWIRLIQLAIQHETTALLYWNLQRICPKSVPAGILEPLAARYKTQAAEAKSRAEELVRIVGALEAQGIPALPYKGPVLAQQLYGDLSLREFSEHSDLDIMVEECNLGKAEEVIRALGYRHLARGECESIFRREQADARILDLHWRFLTDSLQVHGDPHRFLQRFEAVSLAGATLRSLPLEVYFLILSLHATKHKWRKLKLICDIAEILDSRNVDWEYVLREAQDLGLRRMLAVAALLAENPLEFAIPADLARRLRIDRVAHVVAADCREELLKQADESWQQHAELRFLFRIRERLCDKTNLFLWSWLWPKEMPDERDRKFAPLPSCLSPLYYFVRPVRLACEKTFVQRAARRSASKHVPFCQTGQRTRGEAD